LPRCTPQSHLAHNRDTAPRATDTETEEAMVEHREVLPVIAAYVIAILLGLAVPMLAVAVYFGIAVFLVLPIRAVARLMSGGS
jgi:hypothetical protein